MKKDPNVDALNRRTRTDVIITLVLTGFFAVNAVFQMIAHRDFSRAFSSLSLFVIFLLTGLIFTDIRKNGKPFAKSVIRKMRILAVTVCCSGYLMQFADRISESIGKQSSEVTEFTFYLNDRNSVFLFLLGTIIGILSEIFVYGHYLQKDMDQIA